MFAQQSSSCPEWVPIELWRLRCHKVVLALHGAEALIVVSLELKQLLEVRLAISATGRWCEA